MKIRIQTKEGVPDDDTITLDNGDILENVGSVDISIRPGELIIATLTFLLTRSDMTIDATVSEEHLRELAFAHGFDLVEKTGAR